MKGVTLMAHKLLNGVLDTAESSDGYYVNIKTWGGSLPDALESLKDDPSMDKRHVFVQPRMEIPANGMMSYKKYMIELAIDLLKDMTESLPPTLVSLTDESKKGLTVHGIHEDQLAQLKAVSSVLMYMVNSHSWETATAQPYDIANVQQKLLALVPFSMR
jgi:hypothetical protein